MIAWNEDSFICLNGENVLTVNLKMLVQYREKFSQRFTISLEAVRKAR